MANQFFALKIAESIKFLNQKLYPGLDEFLREILQVGSTPWAKIDFNN